MAPYRFVVHTLDGKFFVGEAGELPDDVTTDKLSDFLGSALIGREVFDMVDEDGRLVVLNVRNVVAAVAERVEK